MGWIEWAAGLVFFDVLMIILVTGAGSSGLDISDTVSYDRSNPTFNSSSTIGMADTGWWDSFWIGFTNMPWWVDIFLITYQAVLIGLIVVALIRGFS